jgi:hypothetical protein
MMMEQSQQAHRMFPSSAHQTERSTAYIGALTNNGIDKGIVHRHFVN